MPEDQFGRQLRDWRERAGLTQEALGTLAGIRTNTVQELEAQSGRVPRATTLNALADALGLTAEERHDLIAGARQRAGRGHRAPVYEPVDQPVDEQDRDAVSTPVAVTDDTDGVPKGPSPGSRRHRRGWRVAVVAAGLIAAIVAIEVRSPTPAGRRPSPASRVTPGPGVLAASQRPSAVAEVHTVTYDLQDWPDITRAERVGSGEITLQGHDYSRELYYLDGLTSDFGSLSVQLGGQCTSLRALAGMTDGSPPDSGSEMLVYVDGAVRMQRPLRPATADPVAINLRGALDLRIAFRATSQVEDGRAVLVDAVLTCART